MLTTHRCTVDQCTPFPPLLIPDSLHTTNLVTMYDPVHGDVRLAWPDTLVCPHCGSKYSVQQDMGTRISLLAPSVVLCTFRDPSSALSHAAVDHHNAAVLASDGHVAPIGGTAKALSANGSVTAPSQSIVRPSTISQALKAEELLRISEISAVGAGDLFPCLACGDRPSTLTFDGSLKAHLLRIQGGHDGAFYTAGESVLPDTIVDSLHEFYSKLRGAEGGGRDCDGHTFVAAGSAAGGRTKAKQAKLAVVGVFVIVCRHGVVYYLIQMKDNETHMYHVVGITLALAMGSNACSDIICLVLQHLRAQVARDADFIQDVAHCLWPGAKHAVRALDAKHALSSQPEGWSINEPLTVSCGPLPVPQPRHFFRSVHLPSNALASASFVLPALHSQCHSLSCNVFCGSYATAKAYWAKEVAEWATRQLKAFAGPTSTLSRAHFRLALEQFAALSRFTSNARLHSTLLQALVAAYDRRGAAWGALTRAAASQRIAQQPGQSTADWLGSFDALVRADAARVREEKAVDAALAHTSAQHAELSKLTASIAALDAAILCSGHRLSKDVTPVTRARYIDARANSPEAKAVVGADTLDAALAKLPELKASAAKLRHEVEQGVGDGAVPEPTVLQIVASNAARLYELVCKRAMLSERLSSLSMRVDKKSGVLRAKRVEWGGVVKQLTSNFTALKQLCELSEEASVKEWASHFPKDAAELKAGHLHPAPDCLGSITRLSASGSLAQAIRQYHVAAAEVTACQEEVASASRNAAALAGELQRRLKMLHLDGQEAMSCDTLEAASGNHGLFLRPGSHIAGRPVLLSVLDPSAAEGPDQATLRVLACSLRSSTFQMAQRIGEVAQRLLRLERGVAALSMLAATARESFTCRRDANASGGRVLLQMRLGALCSGALGPQEWALLALSPAHAAAAAAAAAAAFAAGAGAGGSGAGAVDPGAAAGAAVAASSAASAASAQGSTPQGFFWGDEAEGSDSESEDEVGEDEEAAEESE